MTRRTVEMPQVSLLCGRMVKVATILREGIRFDRTGGCRSVALLKTLVHCIALHDSMHAGLIPLLEILADARCDSAVYRKPCDNI